MSVDEYIKLTSKHAKHYFTIGASISSIALPAVVEMVWTALRKFGGAVFETKWVLLILCVVTSYSVAYFLPEPPGYDDAGNFKLTRDEAIWGAINSFVLMVTVLGYECWLMSK